MNLNSAKLLAKMRGGSHAYGLNTPTSDVDWRGIYASTNLSDIIGISAGRDENRVTQNEQEDSSYTEVRAFLRLLRNGNTQALEMVFNTEWEFKTPQFEQIILNRRMLIDTSKLVHVLKGYALSELKLANGERTGKLGGKRKAAIDEYGFSPKNFVQLLRLLWAGRWFYEKGVFPVDVKYYDASFAETLMSIKTNPKGWNRDYLNNLALAYEEELNRAYAKSDIDWVFQERLANELCRNIYLPLIN